jgi:GNAT superfamily N-acetyltransferase
MVRFKQSIETCSRLLKRTFEVLHDEGAKSLWFKMLGEIVYRRLILVERPLDETLPQIAIPLPLTISLLSETEVKEYADYRPDVNIIEIKNRLKSGHLCFVVRLKGGIVNTGWAATNRVSIDYLSREFQLKDGDVYVYDVFTMPEHRGNSLSIFRMTHMLRYFRDLGYKRFVGTILIENKPAVRNALKADYHASGIIGHVKIFSLKWNFQREIRNSTFLKKIYGL